MSADAPLRFADCHDDLLLGVQGRRERGDADPFGDFWLPELRAGGIVLQVLPIYTEEQFLGEGALRRALRVIETAWWMADLHADDVAIVTTGADLRTTIDDGRIALVLAFEGMEPLGGDVEMVDVFARLGVRMASLTWNRRTLFADGTGERETGSRLTSIGVEAVARMEAAGIIVDVSHLSDPGFDHIAEIATKPFVASHSSCREVWDHPRNLTDARLRTVAASGGFVGINTVGYFCGPDFRVDEYVDHIAHAVSVIGADHVGLGLDFTADLFEQLDVILKGLLIPPEAFRHIPGLERPSDLPALAPLLVDRLGRADAEKVAAETMIDRLAAMLPG